jgi:hypothetical protein
MVQRVPDIGMSPARRALSNAQAKSALQVNDYY